MQANAWMMVVLGVVAMTGCSKAGIESKECTEYFAKVEECAAKAKPMKADILRKTAEASRAGFEKNSNPLAVKKSCELMLENLKSDPDCK